MVSKSSTEPDYGSMSSASSEIVWLQRLLRELGVPVLRPTPLYADSTNVIRIATNPVSMKGLSTLKLTVILFECRLIGRSASVQEP